MPSKTISVTNGDGSTRTITIPDRSRFAGVRNISRNGKLDNSTTSIQVTVSGHSDLDGVYTGSGGVDSTWAQQGGNGRIATYGYNTDDDFQLWFVYDNNDLDPNGETNNLYQWFSSSGTSPFAWSDLPSSHNVTITGVETITVNRTAPVITSDRKGESRPLLSKVVGGAAAAYSLRDLNDRNGNNKVVRVRRASDNAERDFLAKEVSNGTLKNWVNTQTVLPLDIQELTNDGRTGSVIPAKAAYSLRNLSSTYTGNVVDVRRSSDSTVQGFTASQVTDGSLLNFVNVGDQYKGYSFFANNASARVNFGSTIALESDNDWSLKFNIIMGEASANGYGVLRNTGTGSNGSMFIQPLRNKVSFTNNSGSFTNINLTTAISKGQPAEIELINEAGSGVTVKIDGVISSSQTSIGDVTFNCFGNGRSRTGERVIFDVEVDLTGDGTVDHKYAGDGITNSNWADQAGSNNGTILNSTYITAYNNEFTNGFVSKWYDQSGNTNHATQTTPASQPKIVDAGSLLTDGIDFDGSEDMSLVTGSFSLTQTYTTFSVSHTDDASTSQGVWSTAPSISNQFNSVSFFRSDGGFAVNSGVTRTTAGTIDYATNRDYLQTNIVNGGFSSIFVDGVTASTGNAGTNDPNGVLILGFFRVSSANANLDGGIKELIIYDSDQTLNRTAIEANIGEHYSISGIPAYDNTVDGFVETWYDQSGNGYDATQATSSLQPMIVEAGALVTKLGQSSISFTGSSTVLFNTSFSISETESAVFAVWQPARNSSTASQARNCTLFTSVGSSIYMGTPNSNNQMSFRRFNTVQNFTLAVASLNTPNLHALVGTSSGADYYFNGSSIHSDTATGTNTTRNQLYIGTKQNVPQHDTEGYISELIIYNSDQSANRPAIEANINNQYEIY